MGKKVVRKISTLDALLFTEISTTDQMIDSGSASAALSVGEIVIIAVVSAVAAFLLLVIIVTVIMVLRRRSENIRRINLEKEM